MDLNEVKTFLRIDGSEDDAILTLLVDAAKEYLMNAGVPESDKSLYKLAVMLHVTINYENRESTKVESFGHSLDSIVLQLKEYGGETP